MWGCPGAHRHRFGLGDEPPRDERKPTTSEITNTLPVYRTSDLAAVFDAYCAFGQTSSSGGTLDSLQMSKLARAAGILEAVSQGDIDVLFTKV